MTPEVEDRIDLFHSRACLFVSLTFYVELCIIYTY